MIFKRFLIITVGLILFSCIFPSTMKADEGDFVRAYVVIAEPYDVLYSCYGHASLRLECPEHNLDYIFSCEGEEVQDNVVQFLMGKLKMGVFAVKPETFLKDYKEQGRGVRQYELNMPDEAKRRLWQQMDERLKEEHVPYDFVSYGCSHLIMVWLGKALEDVPVTFGEWPETFSESRKVIAGNACRRFYWNHLFIGTLVDGSLNSDCEMIEKVVVPGDLVSVLQRATIDGKPLLKAEGEEVLPSKQTYDGNALTSPLAVAIVVFAITMVLFFLRKNRKMAAVCKVWGWALLAFQCVLGAFLIYLVVFSSLPCTEWNWLLVPFNPLPAVLWRWRNKVALPFLAIYIIWCVAILTVPFMCEDYAYIPLALAVGVAPLLRNH